MYWIAFSYKAKEYRRSAKTDKKREAEKLLSFYLGQCARGEFRGFNQDTPLTLFELLDDFLTNYQQRGMRDVRNVRYRCTLLKTYYGDVLITDNTERQIDLYIKSLLKRRYAYATVNRYTQVLRQAMKLALRKKLLREMPHIPRFREDNARQGFFEPEALERMLTCLPEALRDVLRFAGWRKMEILTLEWRDIQGDVIRLRPEIAKNKDGRVLIMVGEIAAIIERRRQQRFELCPYVFHRKGKAIKNFDHAWQTARAKAGLPHRLFHDTRRTAVRNMDRAGVPRQTAKQISGHKTDLIYNRYRIVNEQDIREGLAQAQAYLARQTPKVVNLGHHSHRQEK
jgi:integrase